MNPRVDSLIRKGQQVAAGVVATATGLLALKSLYAAASTACTNYSHCFHKQSTHVLPFINELTQKITNAAPELTCHSQVLAIAKALLVTGVSGYAFYRSLCYYRAKKVELPQTPRSFYSFAPVDSPLLARKPNEVAKPPPQLADFDHWKNAN